MADRPAPRRGEIWYVDFDPARGSEEGGKRPALVIQNDAGNASERYPNAPLSGQSSFARLTPGIRSKPASNVAIFEMPLVSITAA